MEDCCSNEMRGQTFHNLLRSVLDSKIINIQVFTVAVGILFIVILLKNRFRSFCGT
ncbi:PREDICTED: uncharacterized protein LOC108378453 [Rhagoletis zephyria]|uniref:uncharacterized protein LOC108378453 n=1 Tax=Rhagoletis zephyria TaxID=28612 RepID=UPI000811A469|nr:PREDICTED: uncharacterized protein LOC108378453 [Rhagoletis zephyria]XP_036346939.1 uncharacterized protein LOC118756279 [Rhagoletis pomonella]